MLLPAIAPALAAMNARRLRNAASGVTSDARTSDARTCLISIGDLLPKPAPSPHGHANSSHRTARAPIKAPATPGSDPTSGRWREDLVAQGAPQHLADVRLRQGLAEGDGARHLVAGEVLAAVGAQGVLCESRILADHVGGDGLSRVFVRHPDHRRLEHARVA